MAETSDGYIHRYYMRKYGMSFMEARRAMNVVLPDKEEKLRRKYPEALREAYVTMGRGRSLARLCVLLNRKGIEVSLSTLKRLSVRHNWKLKKSLQKCMGFSRICCKIVAIAPNECPI
jgi:hypothetical protein